MDAAFKTRTTLLKTESIHKQLFERFSGASLSPSPPRDGATVQVELLNSALVHAGPVISLAFAANSAHLFTTSLDATVFGLALEGLPDGSGAQPPPLVATLEVSFVCRRREVAGWGGTKKLHSRKFLRK